jgi:hypothetical protein
MAFSEDLILEFQLAESDYQYTEDVEMDSKCEEVDSVQSELEDESSDAGDGQQPPSQAQLKTKEIIDNMEDAAVDDFIKTTCQCNFGPRKTPCSLQFSRELIVSTRLNCIEMTKAELDLVILANLDANRRISLEQDTCSSRIHIEYSFRGIKVCKKSFLFIHAIGTKVFKNVVTHFNENGLTPRMHGNIKRLPANTISFAVTEKIVQFITNFATIHALPLPGRIPGIYSDEKALLLPSHMSKRSVYREYQKICDQESVVSRRKFETLWSDILPHISAMKPATDLCEICQSYIVKITRSANLPENEKSKQLLEAELHLKLAWQEREAYNRECELAKKELESGLDTRMIHLSFDFAQQLHFPSSPQQVGPLYFLTPRKCQLFGVNCEAKGEQVNYLIDENDNPGKGANCVISMVHHYLENFVLPGQVLNLHADNAVVRTETMQ